jgi:hypothetical protein
MEKYKVTRNKPRHTWSSDFQQGYHGGKAFASINSATTLSFQSKIFFLKKNILIKTKYVVCYDCGFSLPLKNYMMKVYSVSNCLNYP